MPLTGSVGLEKTLTEGALGIRRVLQGFFFVRVFSTEVTEVTTVTRSVKLPTVSERGESSTVTAAEALLCNHTWKVSVGA